MIWQDHKPLLGSCGPKENLESEHIITPKPNLVNRPVAFKDGGRYVFEGQFGTKLGLRNGGGGGSRALCSKAVLRRTWFRWSRVCHPPSRRFEVHAGDDNHGHPSKLTMTSGRICGKRRSSSGLSRDSRTSMFTDSDER